MKKLISVILAIFTASPFLCACAADPQTSSDVLPAITARDTVPTPSPEQPPAPEKRSVEIIVDGGFDFRRTPISGVRRRIRGIEGHYTVEYIHTPYGMTRDDTLNYDIELNEDNTYGMTVVSDGITSTHSGRWYSNHSSLTFFFDEDIDPPAHNEYIADALFAEILPHGKLMIYEKGHTVVLSKQNDTEPLQPEVESAPLLSA